MSIGQIVKARREAKGWSQRDLAKHTGGGITQPRIVQLEKGQYPNITIDALEALADAFDCAVTDLLLDKHKKPRSQRPPSLVA